MRIGIALVLLPVLATTTHAAAQKTPVRVEFGIVEPEYVDLFAPRDLEQLTAEAAGLVAASLERRLPVLDLTTSDSAEYRLVITLDSKGTAEGTVAQASDKGFFAQLIGPDSATERSWWALFRRAGLTGAEFGGNAGVPLTRRFLEHIRLAVEQGDVDELVDRHLSRVPIARVGRRLDPPPPLGFGWVAPLFREDLCLAEDSPLRVLVVMPNPLAPRPETRLYEARLESDFDAHHFFGDPVPEAWKDMLRGVFTRPDPADQRDLEHVRDDPEARVAGVFLVHYDPAGQGVCDQLPTPTEAESQAGTGGAP